MVTTGALTLQRKWGKPMEAGLREESGPGPEKGKNVM